MTAATLDIAVDRWAPFSDSINFEGFDFTGGTFSLQARLYRDAPGDPLISLTNSTAPAQGLSVAVTTTDGVPTSVLAIRINETTLEGVLPFAVTDGAPNRKAGTDVELVWDLQITATGFPKARWLEGVFTINAGVNQ